MKRSTWLLLVAAACTRRDSADGSSAPIQAEVAEAQPGKTPSPAHDVAIASGWLDAQRDGNQSELASRSRYPFEIHDEGGNCKDRTATSDERLAAALTCLSDPAVIDVLRRHDSAAVEPLAGVHITAWAEKWRVTTTPNQRIVTGFFNREDSRAHFDLWVADGGVRGVWKSGVSGSRDIEIATEWLAAVKERDIQRLARLTSYPLEVRDTGRDARCGRRVVKGRDTLATAMDCLFHSDRLHQAMVDTPSSGFTAYDPSDSPPDWVLPGGAAMSIKAASALLPWSPRRKATTTISRCWSLAMGSESFGRLAHSNHGIDGLGVPSTETRCVGPRTRVHAKLPRAQPGR